jgi:hypothetical protein
MIEYSSGMWKFAHSRNRLISILLIRMMFGSVQQPHLLHEAFQPLCTTFPTRSPNQFSAGCRVDIPRRAMLVQAEEGLSKFGENDFAWSIPHRNSTDDTEAKNTREVWLGLGSEAAQNLRFESRQLKFSRVHRNKIPVEAAAHFAAINDTKAALHDQTEKYCKNVRREFFCERLSWLAEL